VVLPSKLERNILDVGDCLLPGPPTSRVYQQILNHSGFHLSMLIVTDRGAVGNDGEPLILNIAPRGHEICIRPTGQALTSR